MQCNAAMKEQGKQLLVASIYIVKQEGWIGENDKIIMNRVVEMYWIYSNDGDEVLWACDMSRVS